MKLILEKCQQADFEYLSGVLESYASSTDDAKRKELLSQAEVSKAHRTELIAVIDRQIRYYGSSELAYINRQILSPTGDGGVAAVEVVEDVCEKLKVKIKEGGSFESRLEALVKGFVEKELRSKSPAELADAFKNLGIGDIESQLIREHMIKNAEVAVLPFIFEIAGAKIGLAFVETIVIALIAQIIGKAAAAAIVKELIKRNPWLNALGPIMWAISGTWLAFDLQGPAYRKTVPICLYLGIVALRDGEEKE